MSASTSPTHQPKPTAHARPKASSHPQKSRPPKQSKPVSPCHSKSHTKRQSKSRYSVKNPQDHRYQVREHAINRAILHALTRPEHNILLTEICRLAGISHSVFYNHYRNLNTAIGQIHRDILADYSAVLHRLEARNATSHIPLAQLFRHTLIFFQHHQPYFQAMLVVRNFQAIHQILHLTEHQLTASWPSYCRADAQRLFQIYCGEVQGIIHTWQQEDKFSCTLIVSYANYLTYITENYPLRYRHSFHPKLPKPTEFSKPT